MSGLKTLLSWVISRKIRNTLIVLTALLLTIFVELELKIPADFEVLPQQEFTVRAETAGVLIEISENVREGKRISKGELLARTQDFEKESAADRIAGDIRTRTATLEKLLAEPRQVDINALQSRITEKTVELDNVKKNQQERRVLEETLAQDKTKLGQLQYEAATKKQGFEDGVYAEIIWREAQNKVEVQQHLIQQHEAAIKALDQNTDRQSDLVLTQLEALRTDMVRLKAGPGPQAIREIQSEIDKLKSQLKVLNQEVKKSEIRALIDGTVATPFPERKLYEKLNAGAEFIKLVDTEVVTIEMHVPEKELADIENAKDDLVVRLRARSYPDEYFEGHVRKSQIAPIAQAVNGQKMIAIRTHLPNESGKLKPGMTGKGGIYCGKRRIIYIMTRRMIRWIKVDFLNLLPW
jgi:multidrug resistance efflux pump